MNYLLIKQQWVDLVRREHWFAIEAVPYPEYEEMPAFFKGAYFIPEYRIKDHEKFINLYLGAYETFAFTAMQVKKDVAQLEYG